VLPETSDAEGMRNVEENNVRLQLFEPRERLRCVCCRMSFVSTRSEQSGKLTVDVAHPAQARLPARISMPMSVVRRISGILLLRG
jgi:hypothetical protein